ncbi:MAG: hypothetical protein LBF71_00585 [Campylobacteraceae bacterium]|jgi:hypothetical protein|nr:hypothetical protein [Campylobacteraceae bacterium]
MTESEFLKTKLDFFKAGFTILAVSFAGLVGFLAVNFGKNTLILNCLTIGAIVVLGFIFLVVMLEVGKIFKRMKELIK